MFSDLSIVSKWRFGPNPKQNVAVHRFVYLFFLDNNDIVVLPCMRFASCIHLIACVSGPWRDFGFLVRLALTKLLKYCTLNWPLNCLPGKGSKN